MRDDQQEVQDKEPAETPSSPSAPPESPSRKRLLADPKPRQGSAATSSDSAPSFDSSSDRFRKKTRDLPNLSDCHSCGLHINNTNPKDKLQTLDSAWRIVLLCRRCIKCVESAELCSYCFLETEGDCYRCRDCERGVHKDCVVKYRSFAPWSYCCSELGFSVCVDCWVPKSLAKSNRVYKTRNKKNELKPCSLGDSRVSGSSRGPVSLEEVVNDAKSMVEKRNAVAAKAKENALRKAVVARRATELANGALKLVAKKDENGAKKNECSVTSDSASDGTAMVIDDAELAFQLHRAMNSSPRISKNLCSMNSSCLTISRIRDCNGNLPGSRGSPSRGICGLTEVCTNSKFNENPYGTVPEPSVQVRASDSSSRTGLGSLKQERMVYTRRCKMEKECRENDGDIDGSCNHGDDNSLVSESLPCQKQDELEYKLHPDDTTNLSELMCDGDATTLQDGRCNGKLDRYMLKYSKRSVGLKAILNSETKIVYDGPYVESKATAVGLPLHCSEECRAFSGTVSLQASACASGSSHDPS